MTQLCSEGSCPYPGRSDKAASRSFASEITSRGLVDQPQGILKCCCCAIHVERIRHIKGEIQTEAAWYISLLAPNEKKAEKAVRFYWGVENKLHWRLDFIFDDDKCLLHSGFGAVNMSVIERLCMNMLEKDESTKATKRKIVRASLTDEYRERILFG
jgi:predicted transposase YbfD/YdcC